jgi:hypothetical protein
MNYQERKAAMEDTARRYLRASKGATDEGTGLTLPVAGSRVLWLVHAVPSSFGVAEARELVGRPHMSDHSSAVATTRGELVGPVHVIACHKSCTESQIMTFMGHPDLYVVQAPFGYFVADHTFFVQAVFLTHCRDETSTRLGLQRMFDWLEQSGEVRRLVERATSRAAILESVAREVSRIARPTRGSE